MSLQTREQAEIPALPAGDWPVNRETSLLAAARSGDAAAFSQLVKGHEPRLRSIAQRITHNREDAEDAVQGSLLQAFVHLDSFRGDSTFSSWLARIVTNEALMSLRKDRRRKEVPFEAEGADDVCSSLELVDFGLSPEEDLLRRELQQLLADMTQKLRPNSRAVVQLCYLRQLSLHSTSQLLSLPVSTIKARLHRARKEMRQILENRFPEGVAELLDGL